MDTEFQWEGHNIQINCLPALKYLWMATETIVRVDDIEIGRAGGFWFTDFWSSIMTGLVIFQCSSAPKMILVES